MMERPPGTVRLPGPQDLRGRKILVVDDDPATIRFVREGLGEHYEFLEAGDGEAALALVRDYLPDLVISDVEMPGMGGFELCRILKSGDRFAFIPVILMTARPEQNPKLEGLELGADDYLVKPLNLLELGARVRSMLRLKSLRDELMATNQRLQEINQKLHELSMYDTLTGIFNRLYFTKRFDYEFQRASRYGIPLTCMMIDIDHFKRVNDTYGHQFGDQVLRGVAGILEAALRKVDLIARYGGEEMVVILPQTPVDRGQEVAERLRASVAAAHFSDGRTKVKCTISVGVAAYPHEGVESDGDLLRLADAALYQAKAAGRDRVEVHP
jgi:two-component system cell cycle response regulator